MRNERKHGKIAYLYSYDWAEALLEMPDDMRLKIDDAIKRYALYGEEPTDPAVKYSMFALIRQQMDRNEADYTERCERIRQARSEAGKKHKGNQYSQMEQMEQMERDKIRYDKIREDKDINIPPISKEIYPPTEQGGGVSVKKRGYEAKKFKRPTLDEVRDYIASQSYSVDAEAFIDFYEAKGWRVGNNPMKDWKAAVRTWERRNKEEGKTAAKKQDGNTQTDMNRPSDTPRTIDNCGVSVTLGVGEWIDAYGRRTYGSGKATIPEDAPPRPGDKYTWDAATKSWIYL